MDVFQLRRSFQRIVCNGEFPVRKAQGLDGGCPRHLSEGASLEAKLWSIHIKKVCLELQLLEDDNHWDPTLADAALTSILRQLISCYFGDMLSNTIIDFVGKA
ncbi:hypothetical protein TNIN_421191 [Trichonephila inaurata madagascariensis]|uniref:Uncharacterized protein n=1 Tax=Trichonephila inaurata madagascariensis TaxID=2747483 RepID=A0A8X6YNJ5_9ARAC|nr:hypothetical protein TNIN_421191 [Trichonephila inaurata madagascariensis]